MTREEIKVEFNGLTHDHLMVSKRDNVIINNDTMSNFNPTDNTMTTKQVNEKKNQQKQQQQQSNNINDIDEQPTALSTIAILRRLAMYDSLVLVKRYRACINGYVLEFPTSNLSNNNEKKKNQQHNQEDCRQTKLVSFYLDGDDPIYQNQEKENKTNCLSKPDEGDIVYVPMNGLMKRLDNYDRHGISIDSRVYAFAMGLKTAEKFLTTSSMKEIQETPQL